MLELRLQEVLRAALLLRDAYTRFFIREIIGAKQKQQKLKPFTHLSQDPRQY